MTHDESLRAPRRTIARAATLAQSARWLLERVELFPIEKRSEQLRSTDIQPLRVAVVGPYSAGKSSFINAIIGRGRKAEKRRRPVYSGLLPVGVQAKTAIRTRVVRVPDDAREAILARHRDGKQQELTDDDAGRLIGLSGSLNDDAIEARLTARRKDIIEVEYRLRLPSHFDRVVLIDTPGIDSMQEDHDEIAREAVRTADTVLFLTEDHVTEAEKRFVMDVKDWVGSIIFVQTRCDQEDDPVSVAELTASNARTMAEWLSLPVRPFIATSAFEEIDAQLAAGRYDRPVTAGFREVIEQMEALLDQRISLRHDIATREALLALSDIRSHLEVRRAALLSLEPPSDLEAEEVRERSRLQAGRAALNAEVRRIVGEVEARIAEALRARPDAWEARLFAAASPFRTGRGAADKCVGTIQRSARTLYERELRPELIEILQKADEGARCDSHARGDRDAPRRTRPRAPTTACPYPESRHRARFLGHDRCADFREERHRGSAQRVRERLLGVPALGSGAHGGLGPARGTGCGAG